MGVELKSKIEEALRSKQGALKKLLTLEKERRGVEEDKLVFLGVAEVANYYWCAMKSLLRSKEEELANFEVYLWDRIRYSLKLRFVSEQKVQYLIDRLPETGKELLDVGNELTFSDMEVLLKARAEKMKDELEAWKEAETFFDEKGNKVMVVNPFSPKKDLLDWEEIAKIEGAKVVDPEEFPLLRGVFAQKTFAEKYPREKKRSKRGKPRSKEEELKKFSVTLKR
ncbi:MAG: hypothetical protein ACK401_07110 [Archaeoglobaceae archaeon]